MVLLTGLANVALYLFMTITARSLEPEQYGLFAAVFGLVVFAGILVSGLQTSVAGQVSALRASERSLYLARTVRRVSIWCAVALPILLAATPLVAKFLNADDPLVGVATVVLAVLLVPWGVVLGVYQGLHQVRSYSWLTLFQATSRLLSTVLLLWTKSVTALLGAVAVSMVVPMMIAWRRLTIGAPTDARLEPTADSDTDRLFVAPNLRWSLIVAVVTGFPTLGDLILVRHVYPPDAAGLYAGVALIGRCVLFLPVAINVVLYPRYVGSDGVVLRRLYATGLLATVALTALAGCLFTVVPQLTTSLFLGGQYDDATSLIRPYVAACICQSIVYSICYFHLAKNDRSILALLLGPAAVIYMLLPLVIRDNIQQLVRVSLIVAILLVGVATIASWRKARHA